MKDTNDNGAVANIAGIVNRMKSKSSNSRLKPSNVNGIIPVQRSQPDDTRARLDALDKEAAEKAEKEAAALAAELAADELDEEETDALKVRFIHLLTEHAKATKPLGEVIAEMIAADIDRDTAIDWGVEAGLSEGYVRSTVSSLYIDLTGERKKKAGGGRKANKGALALALRVMTESKDDCDKAKALLLAARRLIEKWEKKGNVEATLAKLRARD